MLLMTFTDYSLWKGAVTANIVAPDVYYKEDTSYFECVTLDAAGGCLRFVGTAKPALFDVNFALARAAYGITAS